MADDIAKQSVSNEAESDTQSTENTPSDQTQDPTDKPNDRTVKTGNPDLDDVFKDAKTPNGDRFNYHYPGTKEELEDALSKIPDAKQTNPDVDVTLTKLPDGRNISTYPKRKSSADNAPRPGWQITKPNSSKLDYKGNTKP